MNAQTIQEMTAAISKAVATALAAGITGGRRGKKGHWHTRDDQANKPAATKQPRAASDTQPAPAPTPKPTEDKSRQTTNAPLRNKDLPYVETETLYDTAMDRAVENFAGVIACAESGQLACVGISRTGHSAHVVVFKPGKIGAIYLPPGYRYFNSGRDVEGTKLVTADWMMVETSPFFAPALHALTKKGDLRLVADPKRSTRSWIETNDAIWPVILMNGWPTNASLVRRGEGVKVVAIKKLSIRATTPGNAIKGKPWENIGTSPAMLHTRLSRATNDEQTFIGQTRRGTLCTVHIPNDNTKPAMVTILHETHFPPGKEVLATTGNGKPIVLTGNGGDKTDVTISRRAIMSESAPKTEPPPANA